MKNIYLFIFLFFLAMNVWGQGITSIQLSGPTSVNTGQTAQFTVLFYSEGMQVGPPSFATYYWSFPGGNSSIQDISTLNVTYSNAGTYTVYFEVTEFGNSFFASRNITVNSAVSPCPAVVPSAPEHTIFSNSSVVLSANPAPSGFTYQWYDTNQTTLLSSNQNYTTPSLSSSKTYYLAYRHMATGCITAKVPVRVNRYAENYNWIRTYSMRDSLLHGHQVRASGQKGSYKETVYYDGLGRPEQKVTIQATATGMDHVTPVVYDALGRNYRDYLPFADNSTNPGRFRPTGLSLHSSFYNSNFGDTYGYSETQFEASPLNRIRKISNPGNAWRMGSGKELELLESSNAAADSVRILTLNSSRLPITSGIYASGTLWKKENLDENKQKIQEFHDKLGRLILKKVQSVATPASPHDGWLCTYYVYDDFGRLAVVIPPKAVDHLRKNSWSTSQSTNTTLANAQYYQYNYDARGRMITKKLPGKNTEEMVYDRNDRLVAWRDALLTAQNKWQYTKYDILDRTVMTGLVTHNITRANLQNLLDGLGANNAVINATSGKSGTTNAGGYPRSTDGNGEGEVLTVNYYDSYSFRKSTLTYVKPTGYHDQTSRTHGLLTGKLVRNLITGTRYETALYYDEQGRLVQTVSDHHLGGTLRVSTRYDFENKPLATYTQYSTPVTYNITRSYVYDAAGQLSHITHRIGSGTTVTLAQHSYNSLNQLSNKSFPGAGNAGFAYNYNIRGWLKQINNPQVSNSATKLFAQELFYETGAVLATDNNWNGNITRSDWRGRDDVKREYRYLYDRANRITAANYTVPSATSQNSRYNLAGIQYDPNGNIEKMQRHNQMTASTFGMVDNLTYTYDTHGNRLQQVADAVTNNTYLSKDFKERNTASYTYNNNGSLVSNLDKEISKISYNYLNLPDTVLLTGTNRRVTYQYDAEGNKVREVLVNGGTTVTRDYIGEFVFVNNAIDHLIHEEGRVAYESGTPRYEFFVKDHLGNVRQVIRGPEGGVFRVATMEPENEESEKEYFENITESRQGAAEHNVTEGGYAVAWLNADRGRILGPARTQEIQEGDTINLSVFGKYMDPKKFRLFPASFIRTGDLSAVASQLNELGQQYAGSGPNQLLLANAIMLVLSELNNKPAPEAYMAYALYDRDSNMYDSGKILLSKKARNKHEELKKDIFVEKDGYIEAFVVNETSENVWYDNFSIQSTGPIIVQETHYDPWGVELQGLGYQEPGIKVNKYLYNGMEYVDDLNLNFYSAFFRSYEPTIGRWWQIDPKSEKYYDWSPYHGMGNNPISISDPLGDEWKTQEDKDHADQISARLSYIDKVYARDEKRLESRISKAEAKGNEKKAEALSGKKAEVSAMRNEISNAQTELAKLGEKDGIMFRFNNLDPSTSPYGFLSTDSDGTTVINTFKGSLGNEVHELKHAVQAREGLIKGILGSEEFKYIGLKRGDSEIEAYRRQYSVTQKVPSSDGGRPTSINEITPHYIRGIYYIHPSLGGKVKPYSNFGFTK
ncbi:DUF6443 domain-containing protein [Cecembia calidifontis]|uniref:RHS repeat-associated protein n=1 Tax=Cecembia calidifontis TaxID=1187080 RepID=A0A4Q7PCG8_9BACT|nr:DUF6443 domain-containing protein [Cecembia calidifontis]RZS98014.1 RHS repeat-associated protein [Cecembia calidifontis]